MQKQVFWSHLNQSDGWGLVLAGSIQQLGALPSAVSVAGQQALTQFAVWSHFPQRELNSTFSGPGEAGVVLLQFQLN